VLFGLGVSGPALSWFCSYLSSRIQRVRIGPTLSDPSPCSRGVPQGSVLGPLLFVLYTRDISTVIPPAVLHQEFADDNLIDFSDHDPNTVCSTLTTAVTKLASWLEDIGLLLNSAKTQVMFLKPRGGEDVQSAVKCNGTVLEVTHSAKYLGVTVDDQLSWSPHVDHVSRKCSQTIGQLWRHGRCLSMRSRRMWYIAMIRSHILYASNCFFPSLNAAMISRLIKLSKAGIRAIFRLRPPVSTVALRSRLKLPSVQSLFIQKLLVLCTARYTPRTAHFFSHYFSSLPTRDRNRVTRGQNSRLLQIPFLPGPSGRTTMQFVASCYWNALPAQTRVILDIQQLRQALLDIDLVALNAFIR